MMSPEKNLKIHSQNKFPDIFDISHIKNIEIFRKIATEHHASIHFFWLLGLFNIEKIKIKNPFLKFSQNEGKKKAFKVLTQIRGFNDKK